ncbi:trigger factor [Parazoarcus communis]|uniref:Trigger factor n=1 Tax=Parazoarcus communis TaxID=41977 RepID=A0A2U8GPG5_9RHOO|nr:trigger factor [Parazoarcus communis]AWI75073.1 trigger factor [Parazoarcus communis]|tara:strand:- start:5181 stop:6485 length:1305 start_codon:yes stop_codon:yes gene_type:complete
MQTNQETPSSLERRIDMSVAMAEINKEVEARLKKMARTVKMPGFRPGKVPMKIVAQTYEPQARSEAIGAAVEKAFGNAVREQNLRVAGYPRIEPKEASSADALEFSAVFEVYPEVVSGDLSTQTIERPALEVGDAEVDKTIDVLRKQRTSFELADRAAAEGDRVVIDFAGRKDGELFDGGQAEDFPFVIGAGSMLKDFETAVTGLKSGEAKTFDMTFPEDYHAKHLAGQTVQFEVKVKKVEAPVLPAVDSDFAKALGVADGDVSKLRDEVRTNLTREVKRRIQAKVKEQVMNALIEVTPIEVPKALVEAESSQLAENAKRDLEARGMQTKDIPVEPAWFADQAVRRVKLGLIMAELVKTKELHAKPEQVRTLVEEMAESYEDPSELVRWYYAQPDRLAQAEAVVIEDNVVAWVASQAQTTDKPVAFDELMGNAA